MSIPVCEKQVSIAAATSPSITSLILHPICLQIFIRFECLSLSSIVTVSSSIGLSRALAVSTRISGIGISRLTLPFTFGPTAIFCIYISGA